MAGRHKLLHCTHCGNQQRGSAGMDLHGTYYPLCHPDAGMDCYRLVTVYQHPAVDCPCALNVTGRATSTREGLGP